MMPRDDSPRTVRNSRLKNVPAKPDTYLPILREHLEALTAMYTAFEDRAPMMEFHVASSQIRVYSARDYLQDLSDRTRGEAKRQYKKALAEGALMVFVRDDSEEILRSYVFASVKGSSPQAKRKEHAISSSKRRR